MKWSHPIQTILLILTISLASLTTHSATVQIVADTLTVHANKTPLSEILAHLQESGVSVAMDERINPLITADFENRDIVKGIKQILSDCDYALIWSNIDGPAGTIRRLSEVLVYKPGDRRSLKAVPAPATPVAQAQTPTNTITCLKNEILLRLKPGVSSEQFRALLLRTGAMVLDGIPALGVYRLRLPPGTNLADILNALAGDPLVATAEPNFVYRSVAPVQTAGQDNPSSPRTLTSSSGPAVAILDSGFTPNPSLEKAVLSTLDATSPGQAITDPLGHGTQMAYLAAGAITPDGIAPSSTSVPIIPIRTLGDNGITDSFSLMQSMLFAIEKGAKVISMSWGTSGSSAFFNDAITYARQQGAILVAAAGNEPTGQAMYPAAHPGVIAVAATSSDGNVWDQSNYGSFVKFAAPGFANLPVGYKGPPGRYAGTSIAAAYTANLLAQYLTLHPKASPADAVAALTRSLTTAPSTPGTIRPEIPRLTGSAINTFLK
jgi:thermitase